MLLDDLLNDGLMMRRFIGLIRYHSRPSYEAQLHESFVDHLALQEDLFTRLHMQESKRALAPSMRRDPPMSATSRSRDLCLNLLGQ